MGFDILRVFITTKTIMRYTISITFKNSLIFYMRITLPPEINYHRINRYILLYF